MDKLAIAISSRKHWPTDLIRATSQDTLVACYGWAKADGVIVLHKRTNSPTRNFGTYFAGTIWLPPADTWEDMTQAHQARMMLHEITHRRQATSKEVGRFALEYLRPQKLIEFEAQAYGMGYWYDLGRGAAREVIQARIRALGQKLRDEYILPRLLNRTATDQSIIDGLDVSVFGP